MRLAIALYAILLPRLADPCFWRLQAGSRDGEPEAPVAAPGCKHNLSPHGCMAFGLVLSVGALLGGGAAGARESVDPLLVLAADVSRSIDAEKFDLRR